MFVDDGDDDEDDSQNRPCAQLDGLYAVSYKQKEEKRKEKQGDYVSNINYRRKSIPPLFRFG